MEEEKEVPAEAVKDASLESEEANEGDEVKDEEV